MKILMLILGSIISLNVHAIECAGGEAQFIGQYARVEQIPAKGTTAAYTSFGLTNFSLYNMSGICPLDIVDALDARISVWQDLNIKDGGAVSGVLVYSSVTDTYSID
jgi:hypothetical protein